MRFSRGVLPGMILLSYSKRLEGRRVEEKKYMQEVEEVISDADRELEKR